MAGDFNPKTFTTKPFQQVVTKPWGKEVLWTTEGSPTTGKFLFTKAGAKWSLQYHDEKIETICLFEGKAQIVLEDENGKLRTIDMELHKGYRVNLGQTHRVIAVEDSILVESSLPETGNTVRVEDDYKRDTETEEMRAQENRGWKED